MGLKALLFPESPRRLPGQRPANLALRALHLVGITGIAGGFLFELPRELWQVYWYLALASGIGLSLLYLASTFQWLFQLKGGVVVLKLVLLAVAVREPQWQGPLFIAIILLSALMAHAPGAVRGYNWCPPRPGKWHC